MPPKPDMRHILMRAWVQRGADPQLFPPGSPLWHFMMGSPALPTNTHTICHRTVVMNRLILAREAGYKRRARITEVRIHQPKFWNEFITRNFNG